MFSKDVNLKKKDAKDSMEKFGHIYWSSRTNGKNAVYVYVMMKQKDAIKAIRKLNKTKIDDIFVQVWITANHRS